MRLPEGAVVFCWAVFGVIGFDVVCAGFEVGAVSSAGNVKKSFNFVFLW